MHAAARQFVEKTLAAYGDITGDVVEFGSRDANGGVRDLFPHVRSYLGDRKIFGRLRSVLAYKLPSPAATMTCTRYAD
jgi:hypothetical protein